ncbi:MAG: hypothetical protein KDC82_03790 [Bacteroidetes bacterium]|nr:hypothetical protein [Bacteroidota bacterium]
MKKKLKSIKRALWVLVPMLIGFSLFFSNLFIKRLYPSKIWLHRCNNLALLDFAASRYSGIEVDVVYYDDLEVLEVNHPPDERSHLFLDDYLILLREGEFQMIWLDLKNLEDSNAKRISLFLASLCEEYQVNSRNIIVESPRADLLDLFSNLDFRTSFYLPYGWHTKSLEEQNEILESIEVMHKASKTDFLSLDYHEYPQIREYFPNDSLLVWHTLYGELNPLEARYLLYKIVQDARVKAVLLSK